MSIFTKSCYTKSMLDANNSELNIGTENKQTFSAPWLSIASSVLVAFLLLQILGPSIITNTIEKVNVFSIFIKGLQGLLVLTGISCVALMGIYFLTRFSKKLFIVSLLIVWVGLTILFSEISEYMYLLGFKLTVDMFGSLGSAFLATVALALSSRLFISERFTASPKKTFDFSSACYFSLPLK
jgi:hypothetical protein